MTSRLLLIFAAVLLTITTSVLWLSRGSETEAETQQSAEIGGNFELTDQNGKLVRATDFRGRYLLVFFGFTHCPDICPVTMASYTSLMQKLGERKSQFVPVFITVDPTRDTPEVLKKYLAEFDPSIVGLTGSEEQIKAVAKQYKAYFARHDAEAAEKEDDYMMDHSSLVYLMGKDGAYITHMAYDAPEDTILKTLSEKAP